MSSESDARSVQAMPLWRFSSASASSAKYRRVLLLLEVDVRVVLQLLERQLVRVDQRMAGGQGHARRRLDELHELHARFGEGGLEVGGRARGLHEHAQLARALGHVVDHALRRAVAERVLVFVAAVAQHDAGERLHVEQVVLTRYCKLRHCSPSSSRPWGCPQ